MGKWLGMLEPETVEDPEPFKPAKVRGFTLAELEARAADDWQEIQNAPGQLKALAKSLAQRRDMAKGKVPDHYTKAAECAHCGPVWLWEGAPGKVEACPWCFNRVTGVWIPRPPRIEERICKVGSGV